MDFKMQFWQKIELLELYKFTVHQIYIVWWLHVEKSNLINFPIHFPYILGVWLQLHLEFLTEWYILSWRFQQQSCSAWWDLSLDIHIKGGPGGCLNFTFSNSGEGGIKKMISDSDSVAQTTPGTIEKSQKFYYE